MYIRKFTGENLFEIQQEINRELGPNAVIITTRTIESGFLSKLFFAEEYEVTVGVDPQDVGADARFRLKEMAQIAQLGFESPQPKVMRIPVKGPLSFDVERKNVLALIGNEGSGKREAAVKLALRLHQETPHTIALASFEGNAFSGMFEHRQISSPSDLSAFSQDLVILDLPDDKDPIHAAAFLQGPFALQVLAVISAADRITDSQAVLERYRPLSLTGMIVTKLSENPDLIMLAELAIQQELPFCYLEQRADLILADADDLETRVINEKLRYLRQ